MSSVTPDCQDRAAGKQALPHGDSSAPYRYQALVVDDERLIRNLTVQALRGKGIDCDTAGDGVEAARLLAAHRYDVVVTDLNMPNRHGHALAVDLLSLGAERSAIVILTGVLEPRLAEDLLARGVDEIEFKPVNYRLFAAKVWNLVQRREQSRRPAHIVSDGRHAVAPSPTTEPAESIPDRVELAALEAKLTQVSAIVPLSQAALDVMNLTSRGEADVEQVAAYVARDAAMAVELLRVANSVFYNPTREKIGDLRTAVVRIGYKRVGELALAASMLNALTSTLLPWMNGELVWRRSMASAVAIELLDNEAICGGQDEGLFLAALAKPLGRIVLSTLYPREYEALVARCRRSGEALSVLERDVFPLTGPQVIARILQAWKLPSAIFEPLRHASVRFAQLQTVDLESRRKVELLKTASLVGRLAVGQWSPWDTVDVPVGSGLNRLEAIAIGQLIAQTRADLWELAPVQTTHAGAKKNDRAASGEQVVTEIPYCTLSPQRDDWLGQVLTSAGFRLLPVPRESLVNDQPVFINCLGVPPARLAAQINSAPGRKGRVIATDVLQALRFRSYGDVIALPCSFAALRKSCQLVAVPQSVPSTCVTANTFD
jgi:HD-like signal output (HDOD) protein/FixJ family two-component response regulator